MKYLNNYSKYDILNKSESIEEFDLEFAMSKIKEKYSEMDVAQMFDEELLEWIHPEWEDDGYESEYDWYMNHNNGEAQDVVIESIINWYKKEYSKKLSPDDEVTLFKSIKSHYDTLDYL